MSRHLFSVFDVTRQGMLHASLKTDSPVFFETPLSLGIVNLKPLRPGREL